MMLTYGRQVATSPPASGPTSAIDGKLCKNIIAGNGAAFYRSLFLTGVDPMAAEPIAMVVALIRLINTERMFCTVF